MLELTLLPFFYLGALASSVLLFFKKRTRLRGAMALAFLLLLPVSILLTDQALMGGLYDHGTADEFLLCCSFTFGWAVAVIGLSLLLARQDPSLSLVFPTIYFLTAILITLSAFTTFQARYDHYYFFHYYSQIFEQDFEQDFEQQSAKH